MQTACGAGSEKAFWDIQGAQAAGRRGRRQESKSARRQERRRPRLRHAGLKSHEARRGQGRRASGAALIDSTPAARAETVPRLTVDTKARLGTG